MDKLVERETATRNPLVAAPALAVQFFLIPLAVLALTVLVYVGFRSLLADDRTAAGLPGRSPQRRLGPALAGRLRAVAADGRSEGARRSGRWRRRSSRRSRKRKDDDPRVRRYLALAIGRLDPPLPAEAVADLTKALDDPDSETRISAIWALGSSGDAAVVPTLQPLYESPDAGHPQDGGLRARRAAGRRAARRRCARRCRTRRPTCAGTPRSRSRATAATRACRCCGRCSIAQYVEQTVKRDVRQDEDQDPIADVMISGLRAAAALKDEALQPSVDELEPAGSQHEGPAGGARSAEGDGISWRMADE